MIDIPPIPRQYFVFALFAIATIIFIILFNRISKFIAIRKALNLPILSKKDTKTLITEAVEKQIKNAEGKKYTSFSEFCFDLPKYSIKDDYLSKSIRNALIIAGVRYKQFVFIDKSIGASKTAWLRWTGKMLVHDNGEYFPPFESGMDIIYYDIADSRPLIDKTKEHDWQDPEMNADLVAGRTNAKTLSSFQKGEQQQTLILYGLGAVLLIVLVTWYLTNTKIDEIAKQAMIAIDAAKKTQGL